MNARIAILAALPRELSPLARLRHMPRTFHAEGAAVYECDRAIAVCAGMGAVRVAHALELAAARGPLRSIVSIGYAGALHAGIETGTLSWPAVVIDAQTGERYECLDGCGTLVTVDRVAGREEKAELFERWEADLVDMESATIARLARMQDLPFRTLRVVSDAAGERLPDLNRFTGDQGEFREAVFSVYVASHPWVLPSVLRLARNSARGSKRMAHELARVLDESD